MKTTNSVSEKYNNWIERYTREIQEELKQAEESISGPEEKSLEIIESEGKKEKGMKKREQNLNDLWDFIRNQYTHYGKPRRRRKKNIQREYLKKKLLKAFQNWEKRDYTNAKISINSN